MAEEIWHHGIKGMKWGVRHTPEQLGHKTGSKSAKKDDSHEDYKNAHDNKSVRKMSDAELRTRLNRLNMEKQYSQMNPSRVSRGLKILGATVAAVGTASKAIGTIRGAQKQYEWIRETLNLMPKPSSDKWLL